MSTCRIYQGLKYACIQLIFFYFPVQASTNTRASWPAPERCKYVRFACDTMQCVQKRDRSFHNKVGFQALEMKPEKRQRLHIVMKAAQILKELRRKRCNYLLPTEWTLQLQYQSSHRWDESENKNNKTAVQSAASGRAAFTIKGHLRFVPSFEGCTKWLNIYHTRFPDVVAEAACLWWGAWYQMAGAMVPRAACSEGAVQSFYEGKQCVQQF